MNDVISDLLKQFPRSAKQPKAIQKATKRGDAVLFRASLHKTFSAVRHRWNNAIGENRLLSASAWVPSDSLSEPLQRLNEVSLSTKALKPKQVAKLAQSLVDAPEATAQQRVAIALLSAELIVRFSGHIEPDDFVLLIDRLAKINCGAFDEETAIEATADQKSLWHAITLGELAFVLSLVLEPLLNTKPLQKAAQACLSNALQEAVDEDGRPSGAVSRSMEGWIGCLTRTITLSQIFKVSWRHEKATMPWKALVRNAVLQLTNDGFCAQRPVRSRDCSFQLMQQAIDSAGFSPKSDTVESFSRLVRQKHVRKAANIDQTVAQGWQSDLMSTALLRNEVSTNQDVISLHWDQRNHFLSIVADGKRLFHGHWDSQLTMNGQNVDTMSDWNCTCWFQDYEVAFVELEATAASGIRHVRQVLLALGEQFALLTESVTCDDVDGSLQLATELTAAEFMTSKTNAVTRDVWLKGNGLKVRAVPIWLPDDRLHRPDGSFGWKEGRLMMEATGSGGLCLPLLLDWNPRRSHRDADWSRLTVTEQREVLTPDQAAAYRVRIGTLQLMIYRSLKTGKTLRCTLGLHTPNETEVGQVRHSGRIKSLVTVEADSV